MPRLVKCPFLTSRRVQNINNGSTLQGENFPMKFITLVAAASSLAAITFSLSAPALASNDLAPHIAEAKGVIKQFAGALGKELKGGMKSGGPVAAIGVCNTRAPDIAAAQSKASGWSIARSSHRLRNPANSPDKWEAGVIEGFLNRMDKGEPAKALEHAEVVNVDGRKMFRYVKAIPTGKVCVACHGATIKPEVEAKLKVLYPDDKARGFKIGDMRGVFTLMKPL